MNILHLSATGLWGGGVNHMLNLCHETGSSGEVKNVILFPENSPVKIPSCNGTLKTYKAPLSIKFDVRFTWRLIEICRKEKIDLIHIHGSTALMQAVMGTYLAKLPPFVLSKKTSFPIKNRILTLYKYNHGKVKKVLCVSEAVKEVARKQIVDEQKLVTVYHGTSLHKSNKTPFNLREKFGIPEDRIIVGTIANHIGAKDLKTWIQTVDELVNIQKLKRFHFVQIGQFSEKTPEFKDIIQQKNLESHVDFLGFIPEASNFIPQFDISLLTSKSEGLPQFIYESFYHKTPVVSTNVGGIPEVIKDGENGFLTHPFQAKDLAEKLVILSQDKGLQQKFTEISFQKLKENYTTEIMARKTLAVYKEVLDGKY